MGAAICRPGSLLPQGAVSTGDAPPILFLVLPKKRMRRARWKRKRRFGGSVCAGADLLPPAGEGWLSRAAVRDGNARPLGKPLARGGLGYIQLLFSLPLAGGR